MCIRCGLCARTSFHLRLTDRGRGGGAVIPRMALGLEMAKMSGVLPRRAPPRGTVSHCAVRDVPCTGRASLQSEPDVRLRYARRAAPRPPILLPVQLCAARAPRRPLCRKEDRVDDAWRAGDRRMAPTRTPTTAATGARRRRGRGAKAGRHGDTDLECSRTGGARTEHMPQAARKFALLRLPRSPHLSCGVYPGLEWGKGKRRVAPFAYVLSGQERS